MGNAGYFSYLSSDWDMTINASILVLKDSSHSRRVKMWSWDSCVCRKFAECIMSLINTDIFRSKLLQPPVSKLRFLESSKEEFTLCDIQSQSQLKNIGKDWSTKRRLLTWMWWIYWLFATYFYTDNCTLEIVIHDPLVYPHDRQSPVKSALSLLRAVPVIY